MAAKVLLLVTSLSLILLMTHLYNPLPAGVKEPVKVQTILMMSGFGSLMAKTATFLGYSDFSHNLRGVLELALNKNLSSSAFGDVRVSRDVLDGVPVVIYRPTSLGDEPQPAVVFFHGGGFVVGSADGYDLTTYTMAKGAQTVVISVDYRLAPDHPFPAAPTDCLKATRHVLRHGADLGVDVTRVGVAGDSAGGNLAAVVSLQLSKEHTGLPPLVFQVLYYPWLQSVDFFTPSYINNNEATPNILTRNFIGYMTSLYFGIPDGEAAATGKVMGANKHIPDAVRQATVLKYVNRDLLPEEFREYQTENTWLDIPVDKNLFSKIKASLVDPLFSPLMADDVSHVPPAFIHAAEFDVLRDDALMYATKLEKAGVRVQTYVSMGGYHSEVSILGHKGLQPETGKLALKKSYEFIRRQFGLL